MIVTGDSPKVYWNYYRTEKPTPEVAAMCDSFFHYLERKEGSASVEHRRSETGDCLCFNDQKMLHGRDAFAASRPFDRILLQSMWKFA